MSKDHGQFNRVQNKRKFYDEQQNSNMQYIESLFTKKCNLTCSSRYELPEPTVCFKTEPWYDNKLQVLKQRLNKCKSQLNDFDIERWSYHTKKMNPAGDVCWRLRREVNPEFLTQAWTKFYECASMYDIIPESVAVEKKLVSLHLCEAPGAFITSLNHFLRLKFEDIKWQWRASTLNPYYEGNSPSQMICDDRFMVYTLQNWIFGADSTGDIMDIKNSEYIIQNIKSLGKVMLVTADGSIDCMEKPDEQESVTSALHYCETVTALRTLHEGGTFIIKIFTIIEHTTINLLYLLSCVFNDVNVFKPVTSKQGNSEVYVICLGYHGIGKLEAHMPMLLSAYGTSLYTEKSLFPQLEINTTFQNHLRRCSEFFSTIQCQVIDGNLLSFIVPNGLSHCIKQIKQAVANAFIGQYDIRPIAEQLEILKGEYHKKSTNYVYTNKDMHKGSYSQRTSLEKMNLKEKLFHLSGIFNHISSEMEDNSLFMSNNLSLDLYNEEKLPLHLTIGKPIESLSSSKFVFPNILNLYFRILKINSVVSSDVEKLKNDEFSHVVSFPDYDNKEMYDLYEKKCFKILFDKLMSMEKHDDLILINMNLLTHFNVSILNILAKNCFRYINFESQIVLKSFIKCDKVIELKLYLDKMCKSTILSALPVNVTDDGDLYKAILLYNNTVYRDKCRKMLNLN